MNPETNLQDFLWLAAGPVFWKGMALVATVNAALLFYALLMSHERNALTYARLLWLGGCILAVFIPLNSGMMIWSLAAIITAGTWMSLLMATQWCHRRGRFWDKLLAVIREAVWKPHKNGAD